jgi:hypothetical protein
MHRSFDDHQSGPDLSDDVRLRQVNVRIDDSFWMRDADASDDERFRAHASGI